MTELEQFIADAEKHQQFDDIPTLCAMLKAAIGGLRKLEEDTPHSHEGRIVAETLAHLNTLAAEALGTKGEK